MNCGTVKWRREHYRKCKAVPDRAAYCDGCNSNSSKRPMRYKARELRQKEKKIMERLTFDGCFCDIAQCTEPEPCQYGGACSHRKVWERLKAYEDTGLEPEEILSMLKHADIVCENITPAMKHLIEMCQKIERERDAAVADLELIHRCLVCAHSIHQTGIPCADRPSKPADGSCDFKWRGVQGEEKKR